MKRLLFALASLIPLHGTAIASDAARLRASDLAKTLAAACPAADYADQIAFQSCSDTLRSLTLPFAQTVAWGGDQPDKPVRRKQLTHLNSRVFQTMYLPLFTFTGTWTLTEDPDTLTSVIRLEAYFRNKLSSGSYPYPFWHNADKWSAYESSNEIRLYLDAEGRVLVATRGATGVEAGRGPYIHAVTPAFSGSWLWQDADGMQQPHVSLFSARYNSANPYLTELDAAYRSFALQLRDQSCMDCHTPSNTANSDRLVLLQTPLHAAGEIDNVISALQSREMPQDDIGLRKELPAAALASMLTDAMSFRDELAQADRWEAAHPR